MTKSTLAVEFAAETLATGEIFAGSNVVMGVQVPIRTRMFCRMAKQGRVLAKNQKTCVETRPIVSHGTANGTKARRPPESCTGAGTRAMAGQLKAIWPHLNFCTSKAAEDNQNRGEMHSSRCCRSPKRWRAF
jgi:hypothetical protein